MARPVASCQSAQARMGGKSMGDLVFVVQKHAARRLHYDFRLELDGLMKSWAIPKGPSLDPSFRRLAVAVEDHPMSYNGFEGRISEGEYGAGAVIVWDRGSYRPVGEGTSARACEGAVREGLRAGRLEFQLSGVKLRGGWLLLRTGGDNWLLKKRRDEHSDTTRDILECGESVVSGRSLEDLARRALSRK